MFVVVSWNGFYRQIVQCFCIVVRVSAKYDFHPSNRMHQTIGSIIIYWIIFIYSNILQSTDRTPFLEKGFIEFFRKIYSQRNIFINAISWEFNMHLEIVGGSNSIIAALWVENHRKRGYCQIRRRAIACLIILILNIVWEWALCWHYCKVHQWIVVKILGNTNTDNREIMSIS